MKTINYLFICVLYSFINFSFADSPIGVWESPENSDSQTKIKPASEIACLAQLYEFGRSYSPSLMGKDSTTESVTEKNQFVENELITVSTTKNDNSWMRTRECDSCNPKKFITELFLRDSPKAIPCGMKFGSDIYHVKSKLGKANNITDAGYHAYYYPLIEQNQSISLHFSDDHLDAIYWRFYWD